MYLSICDKIGSAINALRARSNGTMAGNAVVGEERGRVTDLYVTGWLFAPRRGRWRLLDPTSRRRASSDASTGASAYDASHHEFCFPAAQVSSFLTFISPQSFLIRQLFFRSKNKKPIGWSHPRILPTWPIRILMLNYYIKLMLNHKPKIYPVYYTKIHTIRWYG